MQRSWGGKCSGVGVANVAELWWQIQRSWGGKRSGVVVANVAEWVAHQNAESAVPTWNQTNILHSELTGGDNAHALGTVQNSVKSQNREDKATYEAKKG